MLASEPAQKRAGWSASAKDNREKRDAQEQENQMKRFVIDQQYIASRQSENGQKGDDST